MTVSTAKNLLFPLHNMGIINLEGDASSTFLQGQISCDVRAVTSSQVQHGALCNLKGRVMALLDVIDWQGIKLMLPKNLLEKTQTSLAKTAMLSRVRLSQNENLKIFGFYYHDDQKPRPLGLSLPSQPLELSHNQNACCYSLTESLFILIVNDNAVDELIQPFFDAGLIGDEKQWHELTLRQKMIQIYPETAGEFLPHRMDLHLSGYLSFDKGCYKGQEIVARTHYRAKLKHKLGLFKMDSAILIKPGMKLLHAEDNSELGEIIDCSNIADNQWILAASILFEHPEQVVIDETLVRLDEISS